MAKKNPVTGKDSHVATLCHEMSHIQWYYGDNNKGGMWTQDYTTTDKYSTCKEDEDTNPERWNAVKPGRSFLLSITLNDMYAFIPGDNYYFIKSSGYKFVNDKWFTLKSINNIFLYF